MKNQIAPWGDVLMFENPGDELYFGEVYRQVLQEAWLPQGAVEWARLGKSRRGRRPTQMGIYPRSPTQAQSNIRLGFSLCAAAWRDLPWETPSDTSCDGRWGKEYWLKEKQDRGIPCSYYDLFMRLCMSHYISTGCIIPTAYYLETAGDLASIECDQFYPIRAPNKCERLYLSAGEGFYSELDGWKLHLCCNQSPEIGYETLTMALGQSQSLWVVDPEKGEPGNLTFEDKSGAVGCLEYGQASMYECEYTWQVTSGGGTISPSKGLQVTYTAPSTNPSCTLNPTIKCSTLKADSTISLGINSYTGDEIAFITTKYPTPCWDPSAICVEGSGFTIPTPKTLRHRCDGTFIDESTWCSGASCSGSGCTCAYEAHPFSFPYQCEQVFYQCHGYGGIYFGQSNDVRTPQMIEQGCCPGELA